MQGFVFLVEFLVFSGTIYVLSALPLCSLQCGDNYMLMIHCSCFLYFVNISYYVCLERHLSTQASCVSDRVMDNSSTRPKRTITVPARYRA